MDFTRDKRTLTGFIYFVLLKGNQVICSGVKQIRRKGTEGLSLNPEARLWINIPIPLRPVGLSSEGCRGRGPVAVDQYSCSPCLVLVWAGNNFILIF